MSRKGKESLFIEGCYIPKKEKLFYRFIKRSTDIVVSFLGIVIISPILLICLILSLCSTASKPIFGDPRIGKNGARIEVFKFRTMYKDAESNIEKYLSPEQIEQWEKERKVDDDPRVTRIGRILRATSVDELPQLFNVLIGNMSLIGPRPITEREIVENFTEKEKGLLLSGRPGMTGIWQVYGRTDDTWGSGRRKKLELLYMQKRSLGLDFKILLLTIPSCIAFTHHNQVLDKKKRKARKK